MKQFLEEILNGRSLSRVEAEQALGRLIDPPGAAAEVIGGFLLALRAKGESVDEMLGFVDCLRKRAVAVDAGGDRLLDVCGTGGDSSGTFNVSTTVAFVVAASGQPIAKHGNAAVSSRSGSFDVLAALGIPGQLTAQSVQQALAESGLAFLFAPAFHPALKPLSSIRRNLGVRTVFNALGPLLNPVLVQRQLIGVYSPALQEKVAEVLKRRNVVHAMVVHGTDGLDELSLSAPTRILQLEGGTVRERIVAPEEFGLKRAPIEALKGGAPEENAAILREILRGEPGPRRDVVLLNSAAALIVAGKAGRFEEGIEIAAATIDSGRATALLERMTASAQHTGEAKG
jgi:anthranilate phosphoribosyltransferase